MDASLYISNPQIPLVEVINDFSKAEVRINLLAILHSPTPFYTDPSREETVNTMVQDLFDVNHTSGQTEANSPIYERTMDGSRLVSVLKDLTQNFQEIHSMTNDPELRAADRVIASTLLTCDKVD